MIVARHEVPGVEFGHLKELRPPAGPRPVGYGTIGRSQSQRYFSWKWAPFRIGAHNLHESYRTLRDGSLGWRYPGTSCLATISLSLRDKSHSPIEGPRIKLALMG
jgi:hypothetical protein